MTLIRTLELEDDLIEVHYNPLLKNKPYLVRVFNYNNTDPNELRGDLFKVGIDKCRCCGILS